jgi:UDP-galactopyranose mutase
MKDLRLLFVGAGFSGAVVARQLAESLDRKILAIDERSHLAGDCRTKRDPKSGIMLHRYGAHIFHTSREDVWNYVRRFGGFGRFINRVKPTTKRGVFGLPLNLLTINHFFGKRFSPNEARAFIGKLGDASIGEPKNFEEQALKFLGRELYETFFLHYTRKQWGCDPRQLPTSLLKRLPVRFNYDDAYFSDPYQGIPLKGYTTLIERVLEHPQIEIRLETP